VAKICYHAGVAAGMNYGVLESGAPHSNIDDAFKDHFRYDRDAIDWPRNIDEMTWNIKWFRPFEMSGYKPPEAGGRGHAWVVHGYDKSNDPDRLFWVNFGWGGTDDGWYACDSLQFSENQRHITRIAPEDVVSFVGRDDSFIGDGSPDEPYRDIETALSMAADSAIFIFKAGSVNTFSATELIINEPLILKGEQAVICEEGTWKEPIPGVFEKKMQYKDLDRRPEHSESAIRKSSR
jgi:hypothetical protein